MKKLKHLIAYGAAVPLLWTVAHLPFRLLYCLSDVLYLLLYHLTGYRRQVVRQNLAIAFPEKSPAERLRIEKAFYRHLADLFLEMIKTAGTDVDTLNRHWALENPEVLQPYFAQNKSVIIMSGHHGNWEWTIASKPQLKHQPMAIYKKLSNPYFDCLMLRSRSKFGWDIVPTYEAKDFIRRMETEGKPMLYGFAADQNPLPHKARLWHPFFGRKVPWFTGAEETARAYELPVFFMDIRKTARGVYRARLIPIGEPPYAEASYSLTEKYISMLEEAVRRQPETYYWIHRRFKHARD